MRLKICLAFATLVSLVALSTERTEAVDARVMSLAQLDGQLRSNVWLLTMPDGNNQVIKLALKDDVNSTVNTAVTPIQASIAAVTARVANLENTAVTLRADVNNVSGPILQSDVSNAVNQRVNDAYKQSLVDAIAVTIANQLSDPKSEFYKALLRRAKSEACIDMRDNNQNLSIKCPDQ